MKAWKLFHKRKNGTLGPLFINRKQVIPIGAWLPAEDHPTKGYLPRRGWHATTKRSAPHLSKKNRVWKRVILVLKTENYKYTRPKSQGGTWYLADYMLVL
jgi:hypothetical protein